MRATIAGSVIVLVIVILVVALGGCGGGGGGGITLSGRVVDGGTLQPIMNAGILVGSPTEATTDSTGRFSVSGVSSSLNSLTVTANGYVTQAVPVAAGSGDKSVGDVYLVPAQVSGTGNITGRLTVGGTTVSGAIVTVGTHRATTRSDGTYTVYNVPAGFQTVLATYTDSTGQTVGGHLSVTVIAGDTVTASFSLSVQPPAPPV